MKFQTVCKLPLEDGARCGHVIVNNVNGAIELPELGNTPSDRARKFVQAIVAHMAKKHPQFTSTMMNLSEQFIAYQALGFTDTEDPNIPLFMARFAAHLAMLSIVPVSDEALETLVGQMSFTQSDPHRQEVTKGMKYLRDFMSRKIVPAGNPG